MGNKPDDHLLKFWWEKAIREGLEGKGHFWFLRFKLVYWASILHSTPYDATCQNKKNPLFLKEPYIRAVKGLEPPENNLRRRGIRDNINEQLDRIFLEKDGSLNFSHLTDFFLHHFAKDLDSYYKKPLENETGNAYRDQICSKLADELIKNKRKKILLIAHSMGAIIAFDTLTKYVPELKIHTLVTIGSPLGLPVVRSKIIRDLKKDNGGDHVLKTPENIQKAWYNLSDFKDRVSMSYDLKSDFQANSRNIQPEDKLVWNNYVHQGESNHHKSYGYLRCPELAEILTSFLKGRA